MANFFCPRWCAMSWNKCNINFQIFATNFASTTFSAYRACTYCAWIVPRMHLLYMNCTAHALINCTLDIIGRHIRHVVDPDNWSMDFSLIEPLKWPTSCHVTCRRLFLKTGFCFKYILKLIYCGTLFTE